VGRDRKSVSPGLISRENKADQAKEDEKEEIEEEKEPRWS